MVKHCCYGICKSDSRYPERLEGAFFIPFLKPKSNPEFRVLRWIKACNRPHSDFNIDRITKDTYICSKHFVGGNGPTELHPDPIRADGSGSRRKARHPPKRSKLTRCRTQSVSDINVDGPSTVQEEAQHPIPSFSREQQTVNGNSPKNTDKLNTANTGNIQTCRWILNDDGTALILEDNCPECKSSVKSTCTVCEKSFVTRGRLKEHFKIHTNERPYACDMCGKSFINNGDLRRHKWIHFSDKPYKCELCEKSFPSKHRLKIHNHSHTGKKPFLCELCGKSFVVKYNLEEHKKIHTGENTHRCKVCGIAATSRSNLARHRQIHSTGEKSIAKPREKLFTCDVCGKSFTFRYQLKKHSWIHTALKPQKCEVCQKSFPEHRLKEHMRTHTGNKPFSCELCGKSYVIKYKLEQHKKIHTGEKPHQCGVCGQSYLTRSQHSCYRPILARVNTTGGKEVEKPQEPVENPKDNAYSGEPLGTSIMIKYELEEHIMLQSDKMPLECEAGGKAWKTKNQLSHQSQIHTRVGTIGGKPVKKPIEKPYSCDVCEKSYAHDTSLQKHKRLHTGKNLYRCPTCSKLFTAKTLLAKHLQRHW